LDSYRTVKRVYEWKPICTRPQGRPKLIWENDIKNDLKETKLNNWRICIQDRNRWKGIVERPSLSIHEVAAPDEGEEVILRCSFMCLNWRSCVFNIITELAILVLILILL
jgi:hypothetical protein